MCNHLFFRLLIGGFLLLLLSVPGRTCGYDPPAFNGYSLLHPHLVADARHDYLLFNRTAFLTFYEAMHDWHDTLPRVDENIREWQAWLPEGVAAEDVAYVVYRAPLNFFEAARAGGGVSAQLAQLFGLAGNELVQLLQRRSLPGFFDYLLFAKQCEAVNEPYGQWNTRGEVPAFDAAELQRRGAAAYAAERDPQLRLRYGFQLVRLAHYHGGDPDAAYKQYVRPLENTSGVIRYWALGHKAGWLSMQSDPARRAEGLYLLAQVVARTRDRQEANLRSFRIRNNAEWQRVVSLAGTPAEKAAVYYARALDQKAAAFEDLETIYQLDPTFPHLDVLLFREVQKIEQALLRTTLMPHEPGQSIATGATGPYLDRLRAFTERAAMAHNTERPTLWTLAAAYLQILDNDAVPARLTLQQAQREAGSDSLLADQAELLELVLAINTAPQIDAGLEQWLGQAARKNRAFNHLLVLAWMYEWDPATEQGREYRAPRYQYDAPDYLTERLGERYALQGEPAKAYLCRYSIYGLKFGLDAQVTRGVLSLMEKPDRTAWEDYLLEKESIKTQTEVVQILATSLLADDQPERALEVLNHYDQEGRCVPNPFRTSLSTSHNARAAAGDSLCQRDVSKIVLDMQKQAREHPAEAGALHLRLGNYYYNTSYFGYAWKARDYFVSVYSLEDTTATALPPLHSDFPWAIGYYRSEGARRNQENLDLSRAEHHYRQAAAAADPNLQATALFMLSKCAYQRERLGRSSYEEVTRFPARDRYFRQILREHRETDFVKQAIKECPDFALYARR